MKKEKKKNRKKILRDGWMDGWTNDPTECSVGRVARDKNGKNKDISFDPHCSFSMSELQYTQGRIHGRIRLRKSTHRVMGRSLVRSHRSLICLLRTASSVRALRSFVRSLPSSWERGFSLWIERVDFVSFLPIVSARRCHICRSHLHWPLAWRRREVYRRWGGRAHPRTPGWRVGWVKKNPRWLWLVSMCSFNAS